MNTTTIWEFLPDVEGERRRRNAVRAVAMVVAVGIVVLGWMWFEVVGGFVGVAVLLITAVFGTWWVRDVVDVGVQRVSIRDGFDSMRELVVDGATWWERSADEEGFELIAGDPVVLPIEDALDVSVYPSITQADREVGGRMEFHLVLDVLGADGTRTVAAFDRRVPFRIRGERGLAEAVAEVAGASWVDEPDDPFGELDRVRVRDWWA